jgi:tripartite ATP-independent transporter DctP family solute receptor
MKKILAVLFVLILPSVFIFARGDGEGQRQKMILRWGSVQADATITTKMMYRIIEEVNSKIGGRVEIQGYPNSALGATRELAEGVQAGIVDLIIAGPSQFDTMIPLAGMAEAPYIYRDAAHLNKALNGPFGDRLNEEFLKKNVRILGSFYYGTRQLSTGKAEIHGVKDAQGLKIRVPESKLYMEMVNSWGAKPTPIAYNDLYMSLQTNVVDGQENPLTTFDGQKFYEVQKYIILTDHIVCPNMIFINEDAWKKISPEDQQVIQTAVTNGITWNDAEVLKSEEELQKDLTTKGVSVIRPDVESFRAVTAPWLIQRFETDWGKGTWEFVQNIK